MFGFIVYLHNFMKPLIMLFQDVLKECFQEEDFETSVFIKKYCGVISYEYKRINTSFFKKKNTIIITNRNNENTQIKNYNEFKIFMILNNILGF